MATVRERLIYAVELVTDRAQAGARGFKSAIGEAEGAVNKFKAGASSAFATVQANAGALAIGAGGAIAAFGAKSVAAFQETALAAGKLSDATGLTVQDASRLQEVAGDLGVNTDALAGSLVRMQKAVASNSDAVQELGIETKRTKDGQVDVNATFLDAIRKLGDVQDANKKAQLAAQLFGKGFADSAELILGDADAIQARLEGVSRAQVITPQQVERARKFRDQMDNLSDSLKQAEIVVGDHLVPIIGDLADVLGDVETAAGKASDAIKHIPGGEGLLDQAGKSIFDIPGEVVDHFNDLREGLGLIDQSTANAREETDRFHDSVNSLGSVAAETAAKLAAADAATQDAADAEVDLGDKAANAKPKIGDMAGALADAKQHLADLNQEARDNALSFLGAAAQGVADALDTAFGSFEDDLSSLDLLDDITDQFDAVAEAQKNATSPKGVRDLNGEVRRLQGELLTFLKTVKDIPPDKKVEILAQIRTGDVETLKTVLDELTQDRFINIGIATKGIPLFNGANVDFNPAAGSITPILNPVAPVQNAIPGGTFDQRTIINNYPIGSTPTTQFVDQQIDIRRNGTRS